jgi:hypothetical protein
MRTAPWLSLGGLIAAVACGDSGDAMDGAGGDPGAGGTVTATGGSSNAGTGGTSLDGASPETGGANPGSGGGGTGGAAPTCGSCASYGGVSAVGNAPGALNELSGLAASHLHDDVLYTHNDSGDSARFFAMSYTGENLGEFALTGASAADWEDIAVGPCPAGSCVFLGDIGDNPETRQEYVVYRVTEPDVSVGNPVGQVTIAYERLPFEYPDGSHNSETLLVNPSTGDIYTVTKVSNASGRVYRFPTPFTPGVQATLVFVVTLALAPSAGVITAGDLHPCEYRLLIRTYDSLYELESSPSDPFENLFSAMPNPVPVASEPQGEAVAYRRDGRGYFTASEGTNVPLNAVNCQ